MKKRRFLSILLSLALALGLMPAMSLTAYAAGPAIINDNTKAWSGDSTINQQVEINGEVTVSADMTLTIPETYTLKVNGGINAKGKTLTVTGPGTLDVFGLNTNSMQGAGIQGNIIVNGATVLVEAEQRRGIWGNVTVNGGEITVKGGTGVDNSSSPGSGSTGGEAIWGNVTVKGGKITAEGGTGGPGTTGKAGTGGKGVYGTVTVDGGKITVIGGNGGNSQSGSGGNGGYGISGSLIVNGGEAEVTGGIGGTGGSSGKNEAAVSSTISGTGAQESDDGNTWSAISEDRSTKRYVKLQGSTAVTGVKLDPSTAQTVSVGDKVSFTASIEPNDATNKKVKWSVGGTDANAVKLYSNEACTTEVGADATETLTVYAKGVSAGTATVTAISNADSTKSDSCTVTVEKIGWKVGDSINLSGKYFYSDDNKTPYLGDTTTKTVPTPTYSSGVGQWTFKSVIGNVGVWLSVPSACAPV